MRDAARQTLKQDQITYFDYWYLPVIRELVTEMPFNGNYEKLANMLDPPITSAEAEKAVKLLLEIGLIKRTQKRYIQVAPIVGIPDNKYPSQYAVHKAKRFQKHHIDLGKRALDVILPDKRNISCCTVALDKKTAEKILNQIVSFRKRIVKIACKTKKPDRVYQLNLQCFPETVLPD